jgi:thymidine phosphorylase
MEHFFSEEKDAIQVITMCGKTLNRCRQVINKMRDMQIRDIEVAALAAIILWNECNSQEGVYLKLELNNKYIYL